MKQIKAILAIVLIVAMLLAGCSSSSKGLKDGEYTGEGQGNNGPIKVLMTAKDGKIVDVKVTDHSETKGITEPAQERIPKEIVENQSVAVDTVSGATNSSKGIIEAVKDAIVKAGGDIADYQVAVNDKKGGETKEVTTDILIIGGGGSGLQAGLRALDQGKKVTLIEKNAALGGATAMNGSNILSTGSELQKEIFGKDHGDSADLLYNDIKKGSKDTIKPELTRVDADILGEAMDWVVKTAGLKYQKAETQTVDHSVPRQIEVASQSSAEVIEVVSNKFKELGGTILLDTQADKLVEKDGVVTGAVATDLDGNTLNITAKSVIIATGGYGADEQYRSQSMKGYLYYGPTFSTGDGLEMAQAIGADADNLDWFKVYPHGWEVEPGRGKLTTYSSKQATDMGAIYVNSKGERLLDESSTYSTFKEKIAEQEDAIAFLVMDQKTWDEFYRLATKHGFSEEEINGYLANNGAKTPIVVKSGSLEEAAKSAGVNADALVKTVETYNGYCKAGKDGQFGKDAKFLDPIDGDTYYVVEQKLRFATSLGGLIVNPETMAVKDKEGKEIKNLYAAGEVIGGANGHDTLPSAMNTWNLTSGYTAGKAAADNVK